MNIRLGYWLVAIFAGVVTTLVASLIPILVISLFWPQWVSIWLWAAYLGVGSVLGGGLAQCLARSPDLRASALTGLAAGSLAVGMAAVVSGVAPRLLLAALAYLLMSSAGATLGGVAFKRSQAWWRACAGGMILALLLLGSGGVTTHAQSPQPVPLPDLEAFMDAVIQEQLESQDIPGATVAVVADGEIRLVKGYGMADGTDRPSLSGDGQTLPPDFRPVDGQQTLFRTGSVGKLITWTAVMQLAEQGRLDLDADVNDYLDFTIPATFPQPVTLAHLLTHTGGFEDVGEALFGFEEAQMLPLRAYLTQLQPARIFPPGEVQAYSNYGAALAGYIVERVAGKPFAAYAEDHIFAPLGMTRSTLRQPIPSHLADHVASGYGAGDYRQMRGGFVFIAPYPAGSMSAPAGDMAPFMLAHLNGGRVGDVAILQPQSVAQMQQLQYTPHPQLDGMGYGFMRQQVNGRQVLFHRGSMFQFNAGLYLLPAEGVGLYVAYNGLAAQDAPAQLWQAFMERYYPGPAVAPLTPPDGARERIRTYAGEYHLARSETSGPAKVIRLLEAAQVSASPDGYLRLMVAGETETYVEVGPALYRHPQREEWLAFHTDEAGQTWLSLDGRPAFLNFTAVSAFRVPWYATLSVSALLLLLTALFFLGSALAWGIGILRNRGKGNPRPGLLRLSRGLAVGFVLSFLLFLVGFGGVLGDIDPAFGVPRIFLGAASGVDTVLRIPWLAAGMAGGLLISAGLLWRSREISLTGKLHQSLLAVLALSVVLWFWQWNLLG